MRFLIIDADAGSRAQVRGALGRAFSASEYVELGAAGEVAALNLNNFDGVIGEYSPGKVGGLSALARVRAVRPALPFVFFTTRDDAASATTALKAGASDYVLKPDTERLVASLTAILTSAVPREAADRGPEASGIVTGRAPGSEQGPESRESAAPAAWEPILGEEGHLLDLTYDAVVVHKLDATILYWNRGAENQYGWSRNEAIGQRSHTLLHTEFPEAVNLIYERLLRDGHWVGELIRTRRDGSRIAADSRWLLRRDGEGNPTSVLEISNDVTERRRTEEALREQERALRTSEERYRQMFERNRAIKLLVDPESGLIVQANPAACEFYGYSSAQLQQMHIWDLNTLPAAQVSARMAQAMSGTHSYFVSRHRLANGEVRDVEVNASPIELQGSKLLYSILHDITGRKQAERMLWHHTKRLQILHDIDKAILALKSPQEIAQAALRHLRLVVPSRYSSVMLFDVNAHEAEVLAVEASGPSRLRSGQRMPLDAISTPGQQWQDNVHLVEDLSAGKDIAPALQTLADEGVRAYLSVPLAEQGRVVGRLSLGSAKPSAFSLQHVDIARQVADSLAVAIQNGRLYESEHQARETAEILRAANAALTHSLDLEAVYHSLLEYLAQLIAYDSASLMLVLDDEHVSVAAVSGYENWMSLEQLQAVRGMVFVVEQTPSIQRVLRDRRALLIADTGAFPGWQPRQGSEHVRSWLGVPLVAHGRVIGLCSIDKARPAYFTEEHVQLAEVLAAQAAVAILNAQLFGEVRTGRTQAQTLSRRLVDVQERERRHVARELHDDAGQALTSLMVSIGLLEREADCSRPVVEQLEQLKRQVDGVLAALHRLAVDLLPASLDHLGLVAALRQYLETLQQQSGLSVQLETLGVDEQRMPAEVETSLYRIIQEALTNVTLHANADQAGVVLERHGERLVVIVEDNGIGFDAEAQLREGRLGLLGMRERAEMLGGNLALESAPGRGTSVFVEVPWRELA